MKKMEVNQVGNLSLENVFGILPKIRGGQVADVELITATDGRIWVNVNGLSFIRFKPMSGIGVKR